MCIPFNGNPCITIVSGYSLSNTNDETDIITFYNELSPIVWYVSQQNVLIIGRDMNAHKGIEIMKFARTTCKTETLNYA